MKSKQLTVWEAACIITGYGVGGGVMAMPYLTARNGLAVSLLILLAALLASFVLHSMIAEMTLKSGEGAQITGDTVLFLLQILNSRTSGGTDRAQHRKRGLGRFGNADAEHSPKHP